MKTYLNSKMILFKNILKKKSFVISDKEISQFSLLRKIANKRDLRILIFITRLKELKKYLSRDTM